MQSRIGLLCDDRKNNRWEFVWRFIAGYVVVWLCAFGMVCEAKDAYYQQYYYFDYVFNLDSSLTTALKIAHKKAPGHEPAIREAASPSCNGCQDKLSDEGIPLISTMLYDYYKFKCATRDLTKETSHLLSDALLTSDTYVTHNYEYYED